MKHALLLVLLAACDTDTERDRDQLATQLTHGDPSRGRELIRDYGCGSCHTIPGVPGATSQVGPSLEGLVHRAYLAGHFPNTAEHLVRWIREPQAMDPGNAMPDMAVTDPDASDIAAYLYTLY
jgi:cytochrome c